MPCKINIKIQNSYGVNSIKAQDVSTDESLALIELAKELVAQNAPTVFAGEALLSPDEGVVSETTATLQEAVTPLRTFSHERPTPLTPKHIKMPKAVVQDKPVDKDETPIKLGTSHNPDIKRIIPREPFKVEEAPVQKEIEPDELVFSTGGSPAPINSLADKLISGFQESAGIVVSEVPTIEFLSQEEQLAELNKDYHSTGIKHKIYAGEITPMYRVRCDCPKCGNKGNHYVLENRKDIACYECRASLLVEPAAGKFPNRDEWGNFFIAQTLNPKFQRA